MMGPMLARLLVLSSVLVLAGCNDGECTAACKRVAQCKEDKNKSSERVLGERAPPPDERCMDRCRNKRAEWDKCEGNRRSCSELRGCLGSGFDD